MNGHTLSSRRSARCNSTQGIRIVTTLFLSLAFLFGSFSIAYAVAEEHDGAAYAADDAGRGADDGDLAKDIAAIANGTESLKAMGDRASGGVTVVAQLAWDDADNVDGSRPAGVRLQLVRDGEPIEGAFVDLDGVRDASTAANYEIAPWTVAFTGLEARNGDSGASYGYAVREVVLNEEGEWVEGAPGGYEATVERQDADGSAAESFIVKNRHQPATASLAVMNRWIDNDNASGKRQQAALRVYRVDVAGSTADTAKLVAVDSAAGAVQVESAGDEFGMCAVWDGLPVYEFVTGESGIPERQKVKYVVQEETVSGYTVGYQAFPVDGRDGADLEQVAMDAAELPAVDYRFQRDDASNTVTLTPGESPSAVMITNAIESAGVPVTIVWDDEDNSANMRPESVTLRLYADGAPTDVVLELSQANADLDDESKWVGGFAGLPSFNEGEDDAGSRVAYAVSEDELGCGYATSIAGNQDIGYTVTNSLSSEDSTTSINVKVTWLDAAGAQIDSGVALAGLPPVTVRLVGSAGAATLVDDDNAKTMQYDASDNAWDKANWSGLPMRHNGVDVAYSVMVDSVDGYCSTVEGDAAAGFTVAVRPAVTTDDVQVVKQWLDASDNDGVRPTVYLELQCRKGADEPWGPADVQDATLQVSIDDGESWFDEVAVNRYRVDPRYGDTVRLHWSNLRGTVAEGFSADLGIEGAASQESQPVGTAQAPAPAAAPEGQDEEGEFVDWEDGEFDAEPVDGEAGGSGDQQPSPSEAQTIYEGVEYRVVEVHEGNAVGDDYAIDGYKTIYTHDGNGVFAVKDVHELETTTVTVHTQWADFDDAVGARPDSVAVRLLKDGVAYLGPVVVEEGESFTWEGLPKYGEGRTVEYTVLEDAPSGYTAEAVAGQGDGDFVIVNTYNEDVSIMAGLTWMDKLGNEIVPGSGVHTPAVAIDLVKRVGDSEQVISRFNVPDFADASEDDAVFYESNLVSYEAGEQVRYIMREACDPALFVQHSDSGPMAIDGTMAFTLTNQLTVDAYDPNGQTGIGVSEDPEYPDNPDVSDEPEEVAESSVLVTYLDRMEPEGKQVKAAYRVDAADMVAEGLAAPAGSVMATACAVEVAPDVANDIGNPAEGHADNPVASPTAAPVEPALPEAVADEGAEVDADEGWADEEDVLVAQAEYTPGVVPIDPKHEGYTFLGWMRFDQGNGDIVMEAQYVEADADRNIVVSYVDSLEGGQVLTSASVPSDQWDTVEAPEAPSHDGYEFSGWSNPIADEGGNRMYIAQYEDVPDAVQGDVAQTGEGDAATKGMPAATSNGISLPTTGDHTLDMAIVIGMIALISAATMLTARANHRLAVLVAEKEGREPPLDVQEVFEMIGAKRAENRKRPVERVSFKERIADVMPARVNRGKSEYVNDAVGDTFDAWRHRNEGSFRIPRGSERTDADDRA